MHFIKSIYFPCFGDSMARKKQNESIDAIFLRVVPKSIKEDNRIVYGASDYWERIEAEVTAFLQALPAEYVGEPFPHKFAEEGAQVYSCLGSSCDLNVGFSPAYLYAGGTVNGEPVQEIRCPIIDIRFRVISPQVATTILQTALTQFCIYQPDYLDADLAVVGYHTDTQKLVVQNLPLLKRYLPKGTLVEAVTDGMTGVGEAKYRI
jgi:hypothetical protein